METEEKKEIKIGVIIHNNKNSFTAAIRKSIEKNMPKKFTTIIVDSNDDPYLQKEQVKGFIEKTQVDVLVLNTVDVQMMQTFSDWAKKADIPLIFVNREPTVDTLNSYPKSCHVGGDDILAGSMQGDLIKAIWDDYLQKRKKKGDTTINYVALQASGVSKTAMLRMEYAVKRARKLGLTLQQVRTTYFCNWAKDPAKQAMQAALSEGINDIDLVIASNDEMALGAIDALEEIGYNLPQNFPNKFIPIIGFDGLPEAINAIQNKTLTATVKQRSDEMGRVIVKVIENAVENKPFIEDTGYAWDKRGRSIRIPFDNTIMLFE